jgi:hypothetical protein
MKQTIGFCQFRDAFINYDRKENFSYEGSKALFEYLEQYEEDCGEEIELDVVALCCEYSEEQFSDIKANYSNLNIETIDDLREHTQVIVVSGDESDDPLVIYQVF